MNTLVYGFAIAEANPGSNSCASDLNFVPAAEMFNAKDCFLTF